MTSRHCGTAWYTTAEAATYLRAGGPSTVRTWVSRGLLAPDGRSGVGGTWLFRRATLDAFAERCTGRRSATRTA